MILKKFILFALLSSSMACAYGAVSSVYDRNDSKDSYSPWRASFFNLSTMPVKSPEQGSAQVFTYNYFSFDYKLDFNRKYSIRPVFFYETSGYDSFGVYKSPTATLGDAYVQYVDYGLAYLPGEVSLGGQFRVHLPTSKQSKEINQIARFEGVFTFEKLLAKATTLSYEIRPNYYWQSQRNYLRTWTFIGGDRDGEETGRIYQTKEYKLEHNLELATKWNKTFGNAISVGMTHEGYHDSAIENVVSRHTDELNVGASLIADLNYKFNFIASISNNIPVHNAKRNAKLLRSDEMEYVLLTFFRF